jgi:hypothetical protein
MANEDITEFGGEERNEYVDDKQQNEISPRNHQSKQCADDLKEKLVRKCRYLYLYTVKNEDLELQMKYEREQQKMLSKLYRLNTKDIDVDHILFKDSRNNVNVTRLQYK